jgi:hypothetical protein
MYTYTKFAQVRIKNRKYREDTERKKTVNEKNMERKIRKNKKDIVRKKKETAPSAALSARDMCPVTWGGHARLFAD